ncbi:MAG: DUF7694 domain-containing protein [Paraclostridium sp.]
MVLVEYKDIAKASFFESIGSESVKLYKTDTGCFVVYAVENGREHVSISHPKRDPNWKEIKHCRYELMNPNATVAQILPPKERYVNAHNHCFHLWEIRDEGLPNG